MHDAELYQNDNGIVTLAPRCGIMCLSRKLAYIRHIIAIVRASTLSVFAFLRFETFYAKICVKRVDNKGRATFINEIAKQVI